MKLLIYVLTIVCLRGFIIKSKGFVNVDEMYIPIRVRCTYNLYVGNNIARVNHCYTVYGLRLQWFKLFAFSFNAVITIILGYGTESLRIASRFFLCSRMIPNILT